MDWEVDCLLDDRVSGAIKEAEWDWGDVVGSELMIRCKNGIQETVSGSRVNKYTDVFVWDKFGGELYCQRVRTGKSRDVEL